MELSDYLAIAKKRWLSICALSATGLLAGLAVSMVTVPSYTATTQLYVSLQGGTTSSDMLQGANFTRQQVASYTKIVASPVVLGPVIDDLGLDMRADDLAKRVTSESPVGSSLVNIGVNDPSPAVAAALANAIAEQFRIVVSDLEKPNDGSLSTVKLTIIRDAAAPLSPSSPNAVLNTALGLVAGLTLGVVLAVLREILDTKVRSEATVGKVTEASVIGVIAQDDGAVTRPLIVQSDPHSPRAESFRRLRTNIQFLNVAERPNAIVVTSSLPGEGKSTTTINLAISLAEAGTRVALVDADLRRPSVAKYLGIEGSVGLTTALIGRASVADVVQPWGNGMLSVIASGQIPPNPSELLGSEAMSEVIDRLISQNDIVLIDTPPLLPVTDAAVVAKHAGGVLVVVGAGKVHKNQFAEALGALDAVDAHLLGVVVNREPRTRATEYSYYRYETPTRNARARSRRKSKPSTPAVPSVRATDRSAERPDGGALPRWPGDRLQREREAREGSVSWPPVQPPEPATGVRPGLRPQHPRPEK